ncbi:MAG: glycogen/starch synthase [Ignavibacteria bacterium]
MEDSFENKIQKQIDQAQFFLLRYETEFTPCTGITAVSKQERRNFNRGVMISPWCPNLERKEEKDDPLKNGKVQYTNLPSIDVNGKTCKILSTTDDVAPIIFLEIEDHFLGKKTPYDVPLTSLKEDALYFGYAVNEYLKQVGMKQQFIWGADWETVPALFLLRDRHHIALTLHNTFDECLKVEAASFKNTFMLFTEKKLSGEGDKTALEIGIEKADVVTTVNRGFAHGMRTEAIQKDIMAKHLQPLLGKVVGINNASFATLDQKLIKLGNTLANNFTKGCEELFQLKKNALNNLPEKIKEKVKDNDKVIVVTMGRCAPQKQHDVFVESVRELLTENKDTPILAIFAPVPGDVGSKERFDRIKKLQDKFPNNVVCEEDRIPYFSQLMTAADYNCMPSLYEPHGGAFEGIVIPIARAIDGLAEQICALNPEGEVAKINSLWHTINEAPTGYLFREQITHEHSIIPELESLLAESPSPNNYFFREMQRALTKVLKQSIELRINKPKEYANLVMNVIEKQKDTSWLINLGGMQSLIEEARIKRILA